MTNHLSPLNSSSPSLLLPIADLPFYLIPSPSPLPPITDLPFSSLSPSPSPPTCPSSPSLPQNILIPALLGVICVLGVVGNTLALCVLAPCGGGKVGAVGGITTANAFMLNLCVSDLLFLLSLPLWAAYYALDYRWPFGRLACKLSSGLFSLNIYASIFFITGMSVDRYLAIVVRRSHRPIRPRDPRRVRLACALVWALALASSAPAAALRDTHPLEEAGGAEACVILFPHRGWFLGLAAMKMLLGFLLPMVVITTCYCAIARRLLAARGPGDERRGPVPVRGPPSSPSDGNPAGKADPASPSPGQKPPPERSDRNPGPSPPSGPGRPPLEGRGLERALWTVAAVVLAFFLCWFPFHLLTFLDVLLTLGAVEGCGARWALNTLVPLSLCLGFSSSALNPVLYCFLGDHFRGRLGLLWKGLCAWGAGGGGGGGHHVQKRGSFSTRLTSFSGRMSDQGPPEEAPGLA